MSNYVFGTNTSYRDYLQAKGFERALKGEISSATKSIIASNEELQRENISVLQSLSSSLSTKFEDLSIQFDDISAEINELNAMFNWGFSELLTQTGRINDSLQELVRLATTPAQTWAYEQFEIARDADRKGLFEESIQYLDRAINGYGGQTGYKLEYRFHFLLGRIRLGGFTNYSDEIVNLEAAEQAFLYAARYAAQDAPEEAARALLAAGWAAYSRGDMTEAHRHTQDAISLDPDLSEAHFQLAKVLMHVGRASEGLVPLQEAIELDRGYMIKAGTDGDFKPYEDDLAPLFEKMRRSAQDEVNEYLATLEQDKEVVEQQRATEFHLVERLNLKQFQTLTSQARDAAARNTYYGYLDALDFCDEADDELQRVLDETRKQHQKREEDLSSEKSRIEEEEARAAEEQFQRAKQLAKSSLPWAIGSLFCWLVGPVGLILGIMAIRRYQTMSRRDGMGRAIASVVIGGITSAALLLYVLAGFLSDFQQSVTPP